MATTNETDDLAAFFAKKKAKDGKKKKQVVNIDEVGAQLERKAKIQEQWDREEEERSKQELADEAFIKGQDNEDSEWIDATEVTQKIDLGVKDMSLNVDAEEEDEVEENQVVVEPTKTWNIGSEKTEKEEVQPVKPVKAAEPTKYVAPRQRQQATQRAGQLDFSNEAAFPSLSDSIKIEKEEKAQADERKKTQNAWGKPEETPAEVKRGPAPRVSNDVRAEQHAAAKTDAAPDAGGWRCVTKGAPAEAVRQPLPEQTDASAEPKKAAYVPPHMRNKK